MTITLTERWHTTFPDAHVGALLLGGLDNTGTSPALDARKRSLEAELRERFGHLSRAELMEQDVLAAYRAYYRRFDQTYHVQLQLESIVHKGRALPTVSPLVDASFAAELDTLVLTASHDADRLRWPLRVDVTRGGEAFEAMNGRARTLRAGDMVLADAQGAVCTVLTGQDRRTPVTPATTRVLYVCYAPAGVGEAQVRRQLAALEAHVRLFAPQAEVQMVEVLPLGAHQGG